MKATGNHSRYPWLHLLLLLCWLAVGIGVRLTHLDSKPPWSDEWATIVFSLGHSFSMVPLDRPIALDTLLLPLQLDPLKGVGDVFNNLMSDSTHPPLYFILSHWWLKLFSPPQELVSVWLARSLSAMLGAAAIPAMFGLGWLVCRSLVVGQIAAALMAVSPYGIYLSQEARHYTLAILWVIASLGCFAIALQHFHKASLPVPIVLIWVIVNSLGIATHYFFVLALAAQFLVLLGLWLFSVMGRWQRPLSIGAGNWRKIYAAIAGTLVGVFVWLPALQRIPGNSLTNWIYEGTNVFDAIVRLLAWSVTMVFVLPIEGTPGIVTILSGVAVLLVLIWLAPAVIRGWQAWPPSTTRFVLQALGGYLVASVSLIFGITYLLDADLTVAARFQFTYFPALLLLLGAIFGNTWQESRLELRTNTRRYSLFLNALRLCARGKLAVVVTLIVGLLGGLTVVNDFGYQKFERPDLVVSTIVEAQTTSSEPILIATDYKSHGQTAEMIGLAWQIHQQSAAGSSSSAPLQAQFLLVRTDDDTQRATQVLKQAISQFSRLQLWLVNFSAATAIDMKALGCTAASDQSKAPGYRYQSYRCSNSVVPIKN